MNSNRNILFFTQIFVLHIIIALCYQDPECPDKCHPCLREAVVCTAPGRTNLPESISSTVERLTITNQRFSQTTLSSDNFTQFAPPHISLKQLSLRHCNIEIIEAKTFSALTKLESIDLSNNYNLKIASDAFSGLKLKFLQMSNLNLKLGPHVFRGLVVTSLSLKDSSLTTLDYDTLHPLGWTLSNLFLNNNNLKVLDPKLQLVFQRLDSLDLTGNPFLCNCDMKWLMDFYRDNIQNPNFNKKLLNTNNNLIPHCAGPIHLVNRFLTEVNSSELICKSPHISELNIKFNTPLVATVICSGYQEAWKAPMQISWLDTTRDDIAVGASGPHSELFINNMTSSKSMAIQYQKSTSQYKCVINNTMGETSASVRIHWPNIAKDYVDDKGRSKFISETPVKVRRGSKSWRELFFERRYTLLELIAAITGTVLFTGLLFILIHRFILIKCLLVNRKNKKISSQQSNLATVSLTASYEPGLYSNSLTYDVPGAGYSGSNVAMTTPHCTSQQFLDFKTQKKIYRKI